MNKIILKQNLSQKLSPQQIQFIKLLQLSNTNIDSVIKKELEDNPALEEETIETEENETIAIVQAGYADGIPVEFSNQGEVEIEGAKYPIVGKISMDLVAIRCRDLKIKTGM